MTEQWRQGKEISTWANQKFARAQEHVSALNGRLPLWYARAKMETEPVISEDGRRVEVIVRLHDEPPLSEWSLILGDAVHNYRAALDALVWELTNLGDRTPKEPKKVTFPMVTDQSKWKYAAEYLESMPPEALERVRQVQPFNYEPGEVSAIWLLHQLDIQDKHRSLIEIDFVPTRVGFENATFRLEDENAELAPSIRPTEHGVRNGESVVTIDLGAPVTEAHVPVTLEMEMLLRVDGRELPLRKVLGSLATGVRAALDIIETGELGGPNWQQPRESK